MIFCLSGDFIFWVKSPLTNALLAEVLNYYQNASADTIETLPLTVPKVPSGAWRYSL